VLLRLFEELHQGRKITGTHPRLQITQDLLRVGVPSTVHRRILPAHADCWSVAPGAVGSTTAALNPGRKLDGRLLSVTAVDFRTMPDGIAPGALILLNDTGLNNATARALAAILRSGPLAVDLQER
jgi:hypothetical protein